MTGAKEYNLSVMAAILLGLSLTMSGCVVLETESKGSQLPTSASAAPTEPTPEEHQTHGDDKAKLLGTDADYARAVQAFNPRLEHWTVDGNAITYAVRSCASPKPKIHTGTLGPENPEWNDRREITWDGGEDDMPRLDSYVIVTDDYLVEEVDAGHDDHRGVTDVEGQSDAWLSRCKEVV